MDDRKTVLVTGCSSGIGFRLIYFLKEKGWRVFPTVRDLDDMERLRRDGFEAIYLDLDDSDSIRAAVQEVLNRTVKLDALVNNAGYYQLAAVEDCSRSVMRAQFETNVFGPLELTNHCIPVFCKQGYGKIVFINSLSSTFVFPFCGLYASSKRALHGLAIALRRELKGRGIYVTSLFPGQLRTDLTSNAKKRFDSNMNHAAGYFCEVYQRFFNSYLAKTGLKFSNGQLTVVAKSVWEILESREPASRKFLSTGDWIRYWAHILLSDQLQDFILFWKMKKLRAVVTK